MSRFLSKNVLCPACNLDHSKIQSPASSGPYSDYDVCFSAIKEKSSKIQDDSERSLFTLNHKNFIKSHSAESYSVRMSKPKYFPIIDKPYIFYNTAVDSDAWRKHND